MNDKNAIPTSLPPLAQSDECNKDVNNNNVSFNKPLNGAMIVNGVNLSKLKFVKPAPQCFYWENRTDPMESSNCRLWHPRELCK